MRRAALAALAILLPAPALAHPHMYVSAKAELVVDGAQRLVEIRHSWRFDEVFSAYALQGQDADGDGRASEAELQALAELSMESLTEYGWFTKVSRDGSVLPVHPGAHRMYARDGVLTLAFTMKPDAPLPLLGAAPLHVEIGDPEYFIAYDFPEKPPVAVLPAVPQGCTLAFHPPEPLDAEAAAALAEIPAEERSLTPEMLVLAADRMYEAVIDCGATAPTPER